MRFAGSNPTLLEVITALASGGTIDADALWQRVYRPRDQYLINPVSASLAFGDPHRQEIVANTAAWESTKGQQQVDAGSATLDLYLRSLGIPSNLSGIANPPTVYYPIAEGINYKRQFKPVTGHAGQATKAPGTVVEFLNLADTPMADWDVAGPSHKDANVTVRHLGDVEAIAQDYVRRHPTSDLQLYLTPGGFRAWELGERHTAQEFQPRFEQLQVDPDYARLATNELGKSIEGVPIDPAGFRSRISHKPGRVDWVAQPLTRITGREAMPDPVSVQRVQVFHDQPIRQHYLQSGVSPEAAAVLAPQLSTASSALQQELRRRFSI